MIILWILFYGIPEQRLFNEESISILFMMCFKAFNYVSMLQNPANFCFLLLSITISRYTVCQYNDLVSQNNNIVSQNNEIELAIDLIMRKKYVLDFYFWCQ